MPRLQDDDDRKNARNSGHQTISQYLQSKRFREGMERILPSHLDSERFFTIALRQLSQVKGLADCTPTSILGALMQSASLGLEPGINGECWLIPYEISKKDEDGRWYKEKQASLQIGYLGHLAMAWRSDKIAAVQCNYVMRGDHFRHQYGTNGVLEHVPADDRPTDPKLLTHAYGLIETTSHGFIWWVLTKQEIERIRQSSPSANSPAWTDWYLEMAMGKALKRALKFAPKTREMARAIKLDDEHDARVPQQFDVDIPVDLLPGSLKRSASEKQAEQMMDQMRRRSTDREREETEDEEAPIPTSKTEREKAPVMAKKARNANRERAREQQPNPEPRRAEDPDVGDMGW